LLFIREEEKLARDVYLRMYEKWGTTVFQNISESEQRHMDAMKNLLNFYKIEDPITDESFDSIGKFVNEKLALYFKILTDIGEKSEMNALLVGAFIEEYDIVDIWKAELETDEDRIKQTYQNLYVGSYNHLASFTAVLKNIYGLEYDPDNNYLSLPDNLEDLLTQEEYDYCISYVDGARRRG
jgi:hypothetical protein